MDGRMKIKDAKQHFKEFQEQEAENRERWLEDLQFGLGDEQWPEKLRRARENDPDGPRPCLTINKIPAHARQIVNNMRENRAAIRVLPQDDKADIETAEILQGLCRHIEHVSTAGVAYDAAAEYQVYMGVGYFRVIPEIVDPLYNFQELKIKAIRNPFSVYFDPWAEDPAGEDSKRCFLSSVIPTAEYKKEYKGADLVDIDQTGQGDVDGWFTDNGVRVLEHYYLEDADQEYVFVDGNPYEAGKQPEGIIEKTIKIKVPQLHWQKLSGAEILEEMQLPGRYIPVIRAVGEDFEINGDRFIQGIVRRARDAQRMYNYSTSVNAEENALRPKAPWVTPVEGMAGFEDLYAAANRSNLASLPYNAYDEEGRPLPAPQRQFHGGVNSGLVQMMQSSDGDLQSTMGQFAASLGAPSNEKSGIAIRERKNVGDVGTFHYPDNMSRAIQHCGRILIDLIPHYYDTKRVARIMGEDGTPDSVTLSPEGNFPVTETEDAAGHIEKIYNVGIGRYDVAVTVGPSYQTKRQDVFESMATLIQANPQLWGVVGDLLVKNMDWPGADEMAKRIKNTIPPEIRGPDEDEGEAMDPEVMQAFQQMQAMMEQQDQQNQALQQGVAEMQQQIQGKIAEVEMKRMEMDIKAQELEAKREEIQLKREEAAMKLDQTAERNAAEYNTLAELVQTSYMGSEQTQQLLAGLAQATMQQGEVLNAMLEQLAKPKMLSVETDSEGNVVGGVAATIN